MDKDQKIKDAEVNRLRKEERFFFDLLEVPRRPKLHVYMSLFIGAFIVVVDIFKQLPEVMPKDAKDLDVDVSTWYAYPFIILATILQDKIMYRQVCDSLRMAAGMHNTRLTDVQLQDMADHAILTRFTFWRIINTVLLIITWFAMFNVLIMIMFLI